MPSSEITGLTEDLAPATDDVVYKQNAAGTVDRRTPLSALPISDDVQAELDDLASADASHTADTTAVHGLTNTTAVLEAWVSNGAGGYVLKGTIGRIYIGPDDPAAASPGGRDADDDIWIDTSA